jgi:hypothetical protein
MSCLCGFWRVKINVICYYFVARSKLHKYSERTGYRKRMTADVNRLFDIPLSGPRTEIVNAGQCVIPVSMKNTAVPSRSGYRNDGE